jgi:hypothetical protein
VRQRGLGAPNIDDPYQGAYGVYGSNSYGAPILADQFPHSRDLFNTDPLWDVQGYADRQPIPTTIDEAAGTFHTEQQPVPATTPTGIGTEQPPVGPALGTATIAVVIIVALAVLANR